MLESPPKRCAESSTNRSQKRPGKPPAYRKRDGYDQALVTLTDSHTRKRRDYWLGPYGSPESHERYHRLVGEWEAGGRRLPRPISARGERGAAAAPFTINEVMRDYWRHVTVYYSPSEAANIRSALRVLRKLCGSVPAIEFGPNKLRLFRDDMVRGDSDGEHPRTRWTRQHVNGQIHRICAMFKWAASHELLPASQYQQLKTVPALRRGRTTARESTPVGPVSLEYVEAIRPFLNRQVNALITLQVNSGARGGELFKLRPLDITMDNRSGVWMVDVCDQLRSRIQPEADRVRPVVGGQRTAFTYRGHRQATRRPRFRAVSGH